MKVANTVELKNKTNELLRQVRKGESLIITYRGKPAASITPLSEEDLEDFVLEHSQKVRKMLAEAEADRKAGRLIPLETYLARFADTRSKPDWEASSNQAAQRICGPALPTAFRRLPGALPDGRGSGDGDAGDQPERPGEDSTAAPAESALAWASPFSVPFGERHSRLLASCQGRDVVTASRRGRGRCSRR
mgnify:CR=1 FL=1